MYNRLQENWNRKYLQRYKHIIKNYLQSIYLTYSYVLNLVNRYLYNPQQPLRGIYLHKHIALSVGTQKPDVEDSSQKYRQVVDEKEQPGWTIFLTRQAPEQNDSQFQYVQPSCA